MGDRSAIHWTDATWNPLVGCTRVSEGCRHCYAERDAIRISGPGQKYEEVVRSTPHGPAWTGVVRLVEKDLDLPLRWKRPRRIFVNSMSDLFHEKVPDEWIDRIVKVMVRARQHTFQVLTKRPERMRAYLSSRPYCVDRTTNQYADWPTPRIWWGVSVEDQATTDERIPLLLQTPAAVRWVSYEPALSGVDFDGDAYSWRGWLRGWHCEPQHARGCDGSCSGGRCPEPTQVQNERLDWVVVGGESGPGARPFDVAWARQTIAQCRAAGVPAFCKQLGAVPYILDVGGVAADPEKWPPHVRFKRLEADGCPHLFRVILRDRKGGDPEEWPRDLRVREYPHGP